VRKVQTYKFSGPTTKTSPSRYFRQEEIEELSGFLPGPGGSTVKPTTQGEAKLSDIPASVPDKSNPRRKEIIIPAYISGLSLWAVLMMAPLAVLFAVAVLGGGDAWITVLKYTVALLLAMIPGWIYLLFIKNKGQSLYDEYVLNLFRLKIDAVENLPAPPQHTNYYRIWNEAHESVRRYLIETNRGSVKAGKPFVPTKDNLYRKKFETIYGSGSVSTLDLIKDKRRLLAHTETFSPVLFATLIICLGWVLILPPHTGTIPLVQEGIGSELLRALKYAFFGAYAFTIQDLVRRYFRDDLRAGAYLGIVVRIVFTGLIIAVASLLLPGETVSVGNVKIGMPVIAFVIGFFPQSGMQLVLDAVQTVLGKGIPNLRTMHPLSEIDGLNIWYETRLGEEGIEDMQTLASANFVDLMLKTRAPVARLVDWMDQAFLALHVWPVNGVDEKGKAVKRSSSLKGLRGLGIRTATDLERIWAARKDDPVFGALISRALGVAEAEGPAVVESVLVGLRGETNMWHIREFRHHRWLDRRFAEYLGGGPNLDHRKTGRPRRPDGLTAKRVANGVPLAG
jgi:hypothetical protein